MDAVTWIQRRFRTLESLGEPEALVSKAQDCLAPPDSGMVVLKEAKEGPTGVALVTEVELLSRLDHPTLRRVVAYGEDRQRQLAVMEYVEGCDLGEYLAGRPGDVRRCAEGVLRTLVYLHAQGRAHVDLKPANILIDNGVARLIDLGLSTKLGEPPRGGTHNFIPPEYTKGGVATVAGDLYSFGATFNVLEMDLDQLDERLAMLVKACLSVDRGGRPASADGALAMLEALPRPVDRAGQLKRAGGTKALAALSELLEKLEGSTVVVPAAPGTGRTRLVRDALRAPRLRGQPVADISLRGGHDPFLALAKLFHTGLPDDPIRAAAMGIAGAARAGVAIVIDDADQASPQVRKLLPAAAATLAELGCGGMAVVGADEELTSALSVGDSTVLGLEPVSPDAVMVMMRAVGALSDEAMAKALHRGADGRAGRCAELACHLADHPEVTTAEVEHLASRSFGGEEESSTCGHVELSAEEALHRAGEAFRRGAVTQTLSMLEHALPELRRSPSRHREAAVLLACAEAGSGRLEAAIEIFEKLEEGQGKVPEDFRLQAASWLERLGRYDEVHRVARPLLRSKDAALNTGAAAIVATAFFGQGEPSTADETARDALDRSDLPAHIECRLLCVRSDVALTQGDPHQAVAHAEAAQRAARSQNEPTMLSQAIAREAAGFALGGDPRRARDRYRAALDSALTAGDVVGLPPYILNLATAEHALGELGPAVERYQQAARLAGLLGRTVNRAAALVNWAGLLVDIGTMDEAAQVLDDAEGAAREAGSAIYTAQVTLVRAALLGKSEPEEGRRLAKLARQAFSECGAARQALEAELLHAELEYEGGEPERAIRFTTTRRDELERGGLGARASLLSARASLEKSDIDEALRHADQAYTTAHEDGDGDLEARAQAVKAQIHKKLGTGAEQPLLLKAREALGQVAVKLPLGLRERYLQDPSRRDVVAMTKVDAGPEGSAEKGVTGLAPGRILALVRRLVLEGSEFRLLEAAVDEAIDLVGAERAFLLRRRQKGRPFVAVARNIDRETISRGRAETRFSRSVAERVLSTGEQVVTTSAVNDPMLAGARSIVDLGLRSILCVPIRGPEGVAGALYLDHRFETGRFGRQSSELVQALADVIGVALENARLKREAETKTLELEEANAALARENSLRAAEVDRLGHLLEVGGQLVEDAPGGMVGRSKALRETIEVIRRVAPSMLPVLVEGESGTGKELMARFVHDASLRRRGPFMAINCGALPDSLLESELFGHVKGAFTGATRDHPGLLRAASGGTILLDEIGEMSARMQPRLLRALQEGEIWPLGMDTPVPVDVRIVAATNRDLEQEVEAGRFRRDLFYRLVGVRVNVPPLRERLEDLPLLASLFLKRIAKEPGLRSARLSRQATRELLRHSWPGNIRELEQTLRRAALLCESKTIEPIDLGLSSPQTTRKDALRSFDRELVVRTLRAHRGNRTHAAKALGVSRSTLHRWITRYEL